MKAQHNSWKVLKLFSIVTVAAVLSSGLCKANAAQAQVNTKLTIEERLARVREQLQQSKEQISTRAELGWFSRDRAGVEENSILLSQPWNNYWSNA